MAYRHRTLRTQRELRIFLDHFSDQLSRRSGGGLRLQIPTSRIEPCTRVVGVFNEHEEMVGGYVIHDGPALILLSVIPDEARAAWLVDHPLADQCELNLIWRNAGISHTAFALRVWPRIIAACVTNGRRWILGSGYDNSLHRWYRSVRPELIYAGPSTTSGIQVYIYAYTRARIAATYVASLLDSFLVAPWRRRARARA